MISMISVMNIYVSSVKFIIQNCMNGVKSFAYIFKIITVLAVAP